MESASRRPRIQHTDQTDERDENAGGGVEAVAVDGASQIVEGAAGGGEGADEVGEDVFAEGLVQPLTLVLISSITSIASSQSGRKDVVHHTEDVADG
jgi:hypothetical protein